MSLIKQNPGTGHLLDPYTEWDGLFSDFFRPLRLSREDNEALAMPRVDIEEQDNGYLMKIDLPGVKKEDIDVSVHEGVLSIKAESREESSEEKEGRVIRRERHFGQFLRRFNIGQDIDDAKTEAQFIDGVLQLKLPKREAAQAKPVKLKVS